VYKQQVELARTKIIVLKTESKIFFANEDLGNLQIQQWSALHGGHLSQVPQKVQVLYYLPLSYPVR
jgi:hypothetical protein